MLGLIGWEGDFIVFNESSLHPFYLKCLKKIQSVFSLTGVAQLVGCPPTKQKVSSSTGSQGTWLGCGPSSRLGHRQEAAVYVSLAHGVSLSLSPSLPSSLKINKIFLKIPRFVFKREKNNISYYIKWLCLYLLSFNACLCVSLYKVVIRGGQKWVYSCLYGKINNRRISNNTRIDFVLYIHNCRPTSAHPCILIFSHRSLITSWGLWSSLLAS